MSLVVVTVAVCLLVNIFTATLVPGGKVRVLCRYYQTDSCYKACEENLMTLHVKILFVCLFSRLFLFLVVFF